jgi:biotin carboxylase
MRKLIYVAPFFGDATLQFIRALSQLQGAKVGLISQEPIERLPPAIRRGIAAHYRVQDGMNPVQIADAARVLERELGGNIYRMLATLEHAQVQVAQAREWLGWPGFTVKAVTNFRDKAQMKDVLRAAGLPCARHARVTSADEAVAFANATGYPIIIKPPDMAGSVGTYRAQGEAELRQIAAKVHVSPANPMVTEEFIQGQESTFETVLLGGQPVWHSSVYYRPACLHVIENPWIQWTTLLPREQLDDHAAAFRPINLAAVRALGMTHGISHMEWFKRADGSMAISEVGGRPPGAQILPLLGVGHDTDMFMAWAKLAVFDAWDVPPRKYAAAAAFLRGQGRGVVKALHGVEQANREVGHLVVYSRLPRIGQAPSSSYEGDGLILVRHEDTDVARKAVDRLVQLIRVELG